MKVLKNSSPLIVPVSRFSTFEKYLSSLSKSSRHDLRKALSSNSNLNYKPVNFDYAECKDYMDVWSKCNGWSWGDWYSEEELTTLHNRGILQCFSCGASYHFVLRWGRYVYCNAPLYDTNVLKTSEVSKWMWLKLIEYSINNNWADYVDLMGPEGLNNYGEVIKNRVHTNESGDFGYKWKFVPSDIKNNKDKTLNHLEITSEETFVWKGVTLPPKPNKLLIVAHPDDEAIFFGDWLMENGTNTKVACLTSSMDFGDWSHLSNDKSNTRFKELKDSLQTAGVTYFECLGKETPTLEPFTEKDYIKTFLNKLNQETNWEMVVTHNQHGEYGHMQHIEVHDMVKEVFPNDKIYVYKNSNVKLPTNRKQLLLDQHPSQHKYCINEIKSSEWTGSDWYKHTVGKNMIDYESIEKLKDIKTSFQIVLYWGDETADHVTYDFIKKLSEKLSDRGHKTVVSRVFNSWPWDPDMFLTFRVADAEECIENNRDFYFFADDEAILNEQNFEEYQKILDKSIRSFVRSWKIRNKLGDRTNLVWVPRERDWDILVKKTEAHLLMGRVEND